MDNGQQKKLAVEGCVVAGEAAASRSNSEANEVFVDEAEAEAMKRVMLKAAEGDAPQRRFSNGEEGFGLRTGSASSVATPDLVAELDELLSPFPAPTVAVGRTSRGGDGFSLSSVPENESVVGSGGGDEAFNLAGKVGRSNAR